MCFKSQTKIRLGQEGVGQSFSLAFKINKKNSTRLSQTPSVSICNVTTKVDICEPGQQISLLLMLKLYMFSVKINNKRNKLSAKKHMRLGFGGLRYGISSIQHNKVLACEKRENFSCHLSRSSTHPAFPYECFLYNLDDIEIEEK